MRAFFERAGFLVEEAASAVIALRHAQGGHPADAVVSDVLMPQVSRLVFDDRLMEVAPHPTNRVVFLVGAAGDPRIHGAIEQRGVPQISRMDDLRLVADALRVTLLKRPGASLRS